MTILRLFLLYLFLGFIVTAFRPTTRSLIGEGLRREKGIRLLALCIASFAAVALWPIIWITNIRAAAAAENPQSKKDQLNLFGGGNGDSFETAVVVNAKNPFVGIEAEYAYVANQCGELHKDWKFQSQALREHGGKPYDVLTVTLTGGTTRTFYFDIANFTR